jgi:small subunit ribosomal protein S6e
MPTKIIIGNKGLAWRVDIDSEMLNGKSVGETIKGEEIKPELEGYEFEITGGSDLSGFPMSKNIEGVGLKKALLKKGWGMKDSTKGIRRRKTIRGKVITEKTAQINMKILKNGSKKVEEIFADQNKKVEEKPVEKTEVKAEN